MAKANAKKRSGRRVAALRPGLSVLPALVAMLVLAGCSSSGTSTPPAPGPTSVATTAAPGGGSSAPTDSAAPAGASSGSSVAGDDCGGAVARVSAALTGFPEVTKVQTIAACHEVDIATSLSGGVLGSPSATKGNEICEAAAKVAYQGEVTSITVDDTDGHELATGLSTEPCIPG